jgi:hypothetical protein
LVSDVVFTSLYNKQSSAKSLAEKRAANNKQIDIILLDFSKAFDKVPHKRLLNKLNYYGIRSNTLQWIYSFLFHDTIIYYMLECFTIINTQ